MRGLLEVPVRAAPPPGTVICAGPRHVDVPVVDLQLLHAMMATPLSDEERAAVRGKLRLMGDF